MPQGIPKILVIMEFLESITPIDFEVLWGDKFPKEELSEDPLGSSAPPRETSRAFGCV